ncbi:MAG: hypothetical protein WC450_05340 [Candidatus Omnitrophota bacterium]|jgi:hypothetical protein
MKINAGYEHLLNKMCLIESLGHALYEELASKEKDEGLKNIYIRLSNNESETRQNIVEKAGPDILNCVPGYQHLIVGLASSFFRIIPNKILSQILKNILQKRMYSRWFELYNELDPELWRMLLEHEKLQHELLSPYWD